MRHRIGGRQFGLASDARIALLKGLLRSMIIYKKIETTEARAKEIQPMVEKLVTRAQAQSQTLGRQATLLRVKKDKSRDIVRLEEQLADALTAQVEIRVHRSTKRGDQGEVAIAFGSLDELNGLLAKLGAGDR